LALVLAFGVTSGLSGCFGGVEGIVKNVSGGNVDVGGGKLPADFPSAVPLVSGDVVYGAGIGSSDKKVWNVTIKVSDPEAFDGIKKQLTDAGFTIGLDTTTSSGATASFSNATYGVLVVVTKADKNGYVANYTVTPAKNTSGD
jgi:hypothetical protein